MEEASARNEVSPPGKFSFLCRKVEILIGAIFGQVTGKTWKDFFDNR